LVAELYTDGLCTALRHNKPEIAPSSVEWNVTQASDDLRRTEAEYFARTEQEIRDVERCPVCGLPDNVGDCNHYGTPYYTEQAKLIEPADSDEV